MGHPLMFDDDDPCLDRIRGIALAFPGSAEKVSHGRPAFYKTKVFAVRRTAVVGGTAAAAGKRKKKKAAKRAAGPK